MATANTTSAPDGLDPVTALDLECFGNIVFEQAKAMGAMFRAIARLSKDAEIVALCSHGALQADLQANDIDLMMERANTDGLAAANGGAI